MKQHNIYKLIPVESLSCDDLISSIMFSYLVGSFKLSKHQVGREIHISENG